MRTLLWLGVFIVVTISLYAGIMLFEARSCAYSLWPDNQFSSQDWRKDANQRYRYVRSLLADKGKLVGRTRDQVTNMLGNPDRIPLQSSLYVYKIRDIWLFGCGVNNIVELAVAFDENGQVREYDLITD
jgi:hypothetical protein